MLDARERKKLGSRGEDIAARFLRKQGYRIIERNYRSRLGEIDIVAEEDEVIVFVEVKTRRSADFGLPEEALSYDKRQRLSRLALNYIVHRKMQEASCRFDVVSILMDSDRANRVRLIRNAFPALC